MSVSKSDSYAAAGVDVTAGYEAVNRIKPLVESTNVPGVIGGLGGFGGMFEPQLAGMKRPITVSGTDGVGTKLKLAFLLDKHDTVGIDCVAMCVNDIVCAGACPDVFLGLYCRAAKTSPKRDRVHRERHCRGLPSGGLCAHWRRDCRDARFLSGGRV